MNTVERYLTEAEVDEFRADGSLKVGQCHVVTVGICPEDGQTAFVTFCDRKRVDFSRRCERHANVYTGNGRAHEAVLSAAYMREKARKKRHWKHCLCTPCKRKRKEVW